MKLQYLIILINKNYVNIRWIFSFIILIIIIYSILMQKNMHKEKNTSNTILKVPLHEIIDYNIENFQYIQLSKTGKPLYILTGIKMLHYKLTNLFKVKHLSVSNISPQQHTSIILRSNCAMINDNYTKIYMSGEVYGSRIAKNNMKNIYLKTQHLLFLPNYEIAKSDQHVEITIDKLIITGKGIIINNAKREFRLLHDVHGVYNTHY